MAWLQPHLSSLKLTCMTPFTIQTIFLFYSALSFLSATLIGALFWKRNDQSAKLWLWGCLLTSIATAITVQRDNIPLSISYSLMASIETLSILLFSESLKHLSPTHSKSKLSWLTFAIPVTLFSVIELSRQMGGGEITPAISALTTSTFAIGNILCLYQVARVKKEFEHKIFFNFLTTLFGIVCALYLVRICIILSGYSGHSFDIKIINLSVWFSLLLFGSIRNLAYIVLRLNLGFDEYTRLNSMNLRLSDVLEERNEMILSLERLNRSASINALASTVAHEINQPLGASRLNAQFAEMKLESDPSNVSLLKELVKSILEDINRASTIVKNLSRLSSNQNNSAAYVNLAESINQVIAISTGKLHTSKINIDLDCPSHYQININMSEWQQVLINLINNAIEALDETDIDHKKIEICAKQDGKTIKISIQDNGHGIAAGQESKIFDLMVSNKEAGSGIGLWLSKTIINRFDGEISAHNKDDGGACFVIELPSV
jgi:signal transduction histidine kinase